MKHCFTLLIGIIFYCPTVVPRCGIFAPSVFLPLTNCASDDYTVPSDLSVAGVNSCVPAFFSITNSVHSLSDLIVGSSVCAGSAAAEIMELASCDVDGSIYAASYNELNDYDVLVRNRCISSGLIQEYLITPTYAVSFFASAVAVSGDGTVVAVKNICATPPRVEMYRKESTPSGVQYTLVQSIFAPGISCAELSLGQDPTPTLALSADSSILFIGARFANPQCVSIYIYDPSDQQWHFKQLFTSTNSFFGSSLTCSMNGEYFTVRGDNKAYVYRRIAESPCLDSIMTDSWEFQQELIPTTTAELSVRYGIMAISPDGNYIAVSDQRLDGFGGIYVFRRKNNIWEYMQSWTDSSGTLSNIGMTISISNNGDYIVATALGGQLCFIKTFDDQWVLDTNENFISSNNTVSVTQSADGSLVAFTKPAVTTPVPIVARRDNSWEKLVDIPVPFTSTLMAFSRDGSTLVIPFCRSTNSSVAIFKTGCNAVQQQLVVTGSTCMDQVYVNGSLFVTGSLISGGSAITGSSALCSVCPSDQRIKKDFEALDGADALALVKSLQPVSFSWNNPQSHLELGRYPVGFIAQHLPACLDHWRTYYKPSGDDEDAVDKQTLLQGIALQSDSITYLIAAIIALDKKHANIATYLMSK